MEKTALVLLVELVEVVGVAVGAGVLSVAGVYLERLAVAALASGDLVVGGWLLGMGLLALYAGVVMLGRDTAVPRIKRLLRTDLVDGS